MALAVAIVRSHASATESGNHWTSDDCKLLDKLLHRRRSSMAFQAVGCNSRAREGDWCRSHRYQCTTVDYTGRAARPSGRYACCNSKSICGVQDCLSRPMTGDWCMKHKEERSDTACTGRSAVPGRRCRPVLAGMLARFAWLTDDCDCKAENGDWCYSHRESCATPDCKGRTTNKHCVAPHGLSSARMQDQFQCQSRCVLLQKQCQIAGCSGRTKEKRCKE
jgi:hypothetical protein